VERRSRPGPPEAARWDADRALACRQGGARQFEAAHGLFEGQDDIGAVSLERALFTPEARAIQDTFGRPVFDFVSLIDFRHAAAFRR
jgi:hypothetical protein